MRSREIRRSFLEYFQKQGHTIVPSSSLVPGDDPTLLFTNAGMNQFKDAFLGREKRAYRRATTSQKCMRVSGKHNDLDNVGPSLRHHTFFEMLGNFSFGDYFKKEAIPFAWDLLTTVWSLPADRLYPTIFKGESGIPRDEEAHTIWTRLVPADRITELGLAENFWAMGDTGPCGRCSEIHYHRGNEFPCDEEKHGRPCRGLDCSCDRFVEVWNNVFMEFDRQPDGTLRPLPAPSIDTGMGLERITAVIQGKLSNYDTDLFTPILDAIGRKAGRTYGASLDDPGDISMRVIADHLRAMTFLIADGVVPSNEWRGYVLRKIMRRAMRHGKKLGFTDPVLHELVDVVVTEMGDAYPELKTSRDAIGRVVRSEEDRFDAVLTAGLPRLEEALDRAAASGKPMPGDEAFRLYDSLGVPYDFMEDLAGQRQLAIDREGFDRAMEGQREKARAGSAFKGGDRTLTLTMTPAQEQALLAAGDDFAGYESTTVQGTRILALFDEDGRHVTELSSGQTGFVALGRSPFYVEAGGQVSDSGRIVAADGADARVERMIRQPGGRPRLHQVRVEQGGLRQGQIVTAEVTDAVRDATRRNHTATHLLHAALRQVLGSHVKQAGSLVSPDRLRFDFVHFSAMTREQIDRVESIVNDQVIRNTRGADRGAIHGGRHRRRRDGPLRREIRRPRQGGLGPGLQRRAVRRHARAGDRRHRRVPDRRGERRGGRRPPPRGPDGNGGDRARPGTARVAERAPADPQRHGAAGARRRAAPAGGIEAPRPRDRAAQDEAGAVRRWRRCQGRRRTDGGRRREGRHASGGRPREGRLARALRLAARSAG